MRRAPALAAICCGLAVMLAALAWRGLNRSHATVPALPVAEAVAARAAASLHLRLQDFSALDVSSAGGSSRYAWERHQAGQPVERLTYDPWEEQLCWERREAGSWKDLGCIRAD
jgi:hypothetical protein